VGLLGFLAEALKMSLHDIFMSPQYIVFDKAFDDYWDAKDARQPEVHIPIVGKFVHDVLDMLSRVVDEGDTIVQEKGGLVVRIAA